MTLRKRLVWMSLAGASVVGTALVAVAAGLPAARALVAALGGALVVVPVVTAIAFAERGAVRETARLSALVTRNHKRASEWDWRLNERLTAAGLSPRPSPVPSPAAAAVRKGSWKKHPDVGRLMASGIFDAEYYTAVTGAAFHRDADAASHFLSLGMRDLVAPNAFLDPAVMPEPVRAAMRAGRVDALLAHLRSAQAWEAPAGPWFDPRKVEVDPAAAAEHPGGVLGHFLEHLRDGTVAPLVDDDPERELLALDGRAALISHARSVRRSRQLAAPRATETWDDAAEAALLVEVRASTPKPDSLVSVVMPVKDRVHQVGAAIASIQAQTHRHTEILVVDDGSTDGTWDLVRRLAQEDARITVLRSDGVGVCSARNTGLRAATGEYVAFLDSDNAWRPYFVETMLRVMARDGLSAAYAATVLHGRENAGPTYRAHVGGLEDLLVLNHIDLNVLVVSLDIARAAGGFDETMRRWVDHDFAIRVARLVEPVLVPVIGCDYDDSSGGDDRITVRESDHWQWVALGRNWVDWRAVRARERVAGRVSVVMPTYNDHVMTVRAVRAVLDDDSFDDVEVVVVDNGSNLEVGQRLVRAFAGHGRVHLVRLPRNLNFAIGSNVGAAHATGELLMFLNNDTEVRPGALGDLAETITCDGVVGVQPLLLYPDETVQAAGTVFTAADALPGHFLAGHPRSDGERVGSLAFTAVTAAALMMRAEDFAQVDGFDPIFVNGMEDVDLCLRLSKQRAGDWRVRPSAVVTHHESKTPGRTANQTENRRIFLDRWRGSLPAPQHDVFARLGLRIAHVGSDRSPVPAPRPVVVRAMEAPRRWGLHIASIPGPLGDRWGDTHFADSLRFSLEAIGQEAVVHRHGAHDTDAVALDDVVLAIRGLDRVRPIPGKQNILWVISHPELVTEDELREFDAVFAASVPWARKTTAATGVLVEPLLQATDTRLFRADVSPVEQGAPVFVGGTHPGRERKIVHDAVTAGVRLAVYGPGWQGQIPESDLRGAYVPNADLCAVYRGGTRVLADHWREMAEQGFIQNRLFDAVAAGCRVVSDRVDGLRDVFGDAVQVYESPEDLSRLCGPGSDELYPDAAGMREIAALVAREHSFEARARRLVGRVEELL
ncbi:glycosyltransferase [Cellulomonas sp. HD19AZ1]|uniref:glycosyltransferase n=1 Tax=Cellulomonas sp. HD19AZ1 TaxID=2559593 RepID=UPI0014313856|nr:glycosyltransferase [Cellulomonas sp. HD19AZ1]